MENILLYLVSSSVILAVKMTYMLIDWLLFQCTSGNLLCKEVYAYTWLKYVCWCEQRCLCKTVCWVVTEIVGKCRPSWAMLGWLGFLEHWCPLLFPPPLLLGLGNRPVALAGSVTQPAPHQSGVAMCCHSLVFLLLFSVTLVSEMLPAFSFSRLLDLVARTKSILTSKPVILLSLPVPRFYQISDICSLSCLASTCS